MCAGPKPAPSLREEVSPEDRAHLHDLVVATKFFTEAEIQIALELLDERLARGTQSGYHFLIADVEGTPAGYACYGPIPCTLDRFDLYWIAVHPRWQRLGLGSLLLEAVERHVRELGGRRLYLDTSGRDQYVPTRAFYERHGYVREAVLPDFYAPGDPKLIYGKEL